MIELKKCIFCGSNEVFLNDHVTTFWVECNNCGTEGPWSFEEQEAVDMWNSAWENLKDSM